MSTDKSPRIYELLREKIQLGAHITCIYENKEQKFAILIPFIKEGLERHHKCFYIMDESNIEEIKDHLRKEGVNVDLAIEKQQLMLTTRERLLKKVYSIDPDAIIAIHKAQIDTALEENYTALRVIGEMTWVLKSLKNVKQFIEFEAKYNYIVSEEPVLPLCLYDETKFAEGVLIGVLQTHTLVVYGDKIFQKVYYVPPDILLSRLDQDLMYLYGINNDL